MPKKHRPVCIESLGLFTRDGSWEQKVWIGTDSEENETIQPERVTSSARRKRLQALPMIAFSDCVFSKFRQRPHKGHLPESSLCRFTLSLEQGTRREPSVRVVSSRCLMGGTLCDWPDQKATRVAGSSSQDYERRFRASERLFSMGTSRIASRAGRKIEASTVALDQVSATPTAAPAASRRVRGAQTWS